MISYEGDLSSYGDVHRGGIELSVVFVQYGAQGLSQDLETGCPKLIDFVKILGVLFFRGI